MDKIVTWIFGAVIAALSVLLVLIIWAAVYMTASDDYTCEKTGRQVLVMIPSGKVMVPIMQDETICKRVEK
ncbi:hypothetical protein bas10_0070 [Escherichia phage IsaakIselin]|uniref:Uncharacterized protein n=1 Tax=Escherichia phage IsaakIselin TaxID=2851974 RepID=A0AAE7VV06_9CAUD|nr:hypothetical protein bas10_0070 [Escherichia phage IsaakIselin]